MTDQLLTLKEVGARLAMSEKTAQRRVYAGELPWVNIAKPDARRPIIRVAESAVADYIARKTAAPTPRGPLRSPSAKPA